MKIFLIVYAVCFVTSIVLVFGFDGCEYKPAIKEDINNLHEQGQFDEIEQKYGEIIKEAIVDLSKREGWWFHDKTVEAELKCSEFDQEFMHLGVWKIKYSDLSVESCITPNLESGERGCEWLIWAQLKPLRGGLYAVKTKELQEMFELK